MKLGKWLETKYLEWQLEEGGRRSMDEFASYLGISRATVSHLIYGKRSPSPDMAYRLAEKLNDETILDIMGLARTDPQMKELINLYDAVPQEHKVDAIDEFHKTLTDKGWIDKT